CRAVLHVLTAVALLCSMVGAPEHVHEADAAHHTSVTHRHMESHEHDAASVGDDDGRIVWLDAVAVHQATLQLNPPATVSASRVGIIPDGARWVVARRDAAT